MLTNTAYQNHEALGKIEMSDPGKKPLIVVTRSIKMWLLSFLVCTYGILTLHSSFHSSMWLDSSSELANWAYLVMMFLFPLVLAFVTAPGLLLKSNWAKYSYYAFAGYIIVSHSFILYLIGFKHLGDFFSKYALGAWTAVFTLVMVVIGLKIVKIYYKNSNSDKVKYISRRTLWVSITSYITILVSTYIIYGLFVGPQVRNIQGIIHLKL